MTRWIGGTSIIFNLFMCLSCDEQSSATHSTGSVEPATCSIAEVGAQATLACDFKKEAKESNYQVLFYKCSPVCSDNYKTIVDCYVSTTSSQYTCETCDNASCPYELRRNGTRYINVSFTATEEQEGRYDCAIPPRASANTSCFFNLSTVKNEAGNTRQTQAERNDSATGENNSNVIVIVVVVVVMLVVVITAVVVWRKRLDRRCRSRFCGRRDSSAGESGRQGADTSANNAPSAPTNTRHGARAGGRRARRCCSRLRHAPDGSDDCSGRQTHPLMETKDSGIHSIEDDGVNDNLNRSSNEAWKSTPEKLSAGRLALLQPFLELMEQQWKLIKSKTSRSSHSESTSGTSRCDAAIKTLPSKPTDWPPLQDLERQNEWIKDTLTPFVGWKVFPTNTDDAKHQLSDLTELQLSIQCRLEDLAFDQGSCSEEVSKLKESVLAKLQAANKLATIRCDALKALFEDLVRIDHHVKNAHDKMDCIG